MDIMLDLETLGTKPGCVVLSIGAVAFMPGGNSPDFGCDFSTTFYRNIDLFNSLMLGLEIEPSTVKWWRDQSPEAQRTISDLTRPAPLKEVVESFHSWVSQAKSNGCTIWAKSPEFDCAVWEHVCHVLGIGVPWTFRDKRDVRTVLDLTRCIPILHEPPPAAVGTKHNALDDCRYQVAQVQYVVRNMKGVKNGTAA